MQETNNTRKILKYAISSRILLITLIILWRSLLNPYDTSASINPNCLSYSSQSTKPPILLPSISSAIEDSIVWDSVYFVRIAQCGYEYEQTYAFFPLLPILIFLLSNSGFELFFIVFVLNLCSSLYSLTFNLSFYRRIQDIKNSVVGTIITVYVLQLRVYLTQFSI